MEVHHVIMETNKVEIHQQARDPEKSLQFGV